MRTKSVGAVIIWILLLLTACSALPVGSHDGGEQATGAPANANMPNPASVHCKEQGGKLDMREGEDGGQIGICVFEDGSECEEWAFFRGECQIGLPNPASVSCEEQGGTLDVRAVDDGGQLGICVFEDGSECEEWALFRGECQSGEVAPASPEQGYEPDQEALGVFDYAGWQSYTNAAYGFSVRYPSDWSLIEVTDPGNTMAGHRIDLSAAGEPKAVLFIAYKDAGDDRQITPTGMGAGDIVQRGSISFFGESLARAVLVADGKDVEVLYGSGEIRRGDLVFWLALHYTGNPGVDPGLSTEFQMQADRVIASMQVLP
jgi:uncharacterized protein